MSTLHISPKKSAFVDRETFALNVNTSASFSAAISFEFRRRFLGLNEASDIYGFLHQRQREATILQLHAPLSLSLSSF
jgi:hypothetical protein